MARYRQVGVFPLRDTPVSTMSAFTMSLNFVPSSWLSAKSRASIRCTYFNGLPTPCASPTACEAFASRRDSSTGMKVEKMSSTGMSWDRNRFLRVSSARLVNTMGGRRSSSAMREMCAMTRRASCSSETNGNTVLTNSVSGNCVNRDWPRDSMVMPVLSEIKNTFCFLVDMLQIYPI